MKKTKIVATVMAMVMAITMAGCKGDTNAPTGTEGQSSSLPIDASNSNLGSVSEPETSSEAPESTSSEPEVVTPYVPEDAYVPPESDILTTSPEVSGTHTDNRLKKTTPLVPPRGVKVRDDIKLNEVQIGEKIYDINQGISAIEFCKEYGLSLNGGVGIGNQAYYDNDAYNFVSSFDFHCQPIFKEDPNSFKVKQGIDYTYTLYSKDGEASEETETIHNALSLETTKDDDKNNFKFHEDKDDPIRAIATTVPVPVYFRVVDENEELHNTSEQGIYEELQAMMDAQLQVVFAGGVTAGQTKEEIDAYLGKGLEYKFQKEARASGWQPDDYMFSFYKSKDATLVITYALDHGIDFTEHGRSSKEGESKTSYTKNNGYYASNIMLFRNEQF